MSLKETIYDVTTPKSDKVKRNLSDRVITPGRGGKKEVTQYFQVLKFIYRRYGDITPTQKLGFRPVTMYKYILLNTFQTTPYIKTALFSDGKARTPVQKSTSGNTYHSRLHQIIQQEGTSISSKRSNDLMNSYHQNSRNYHYSEASPSLRKSPRFVNLQ